MPNYRYEAEGRDGRKTSGEIAAESRERAISQLSAARLHAIRVVEVSIDAGEIVDAEVVPDREQLSLSEAVDLSALVSGLASSGLPLDAGLKAAALEMPKSRLARALLAVSRRLTDGAPLDQAVASQGHRFPPHLRGLVFAGLRSGRLAIVLEEFVSLEHRAAALHRQIGLALAYPAILISLLFGIFAFFAVAVFPSLSKILDDFETSFSVPTQIAVGFSDAGMYALLGNMAVIFGAWMLIWLSSDLPELRSMLKSFPLLGPIARWDALSRFVRLLALLLESRLPLAESLRMAGEGSRDAELSVASRKAAGAIEDGRSLDESLALHSAFPRSLGPIVVWGQRAVALPEALRMASEMFDAKLQSQLGLLRTAVPALTFLIVLWGIFFLIAAVLFPMFGLIEKLS